MEYFFIFALHNFREFRYVERIIVNVWHFDVYDRNLKIYEILWVNTIHSLSWCEHANDPLRSVAYLFYRLQYFPLRQINCILYAWRWDTFHRIAGEFLQNYLLDRLPSMIEINITDAGVFPSATHTRAANRWYWYMVSFYCPEQAWLFKYPHKRILLKVLPEQSVLHVRQCTIFVIDEVNEWWSGRFQNAQFFQTANNRRPHILVKRRENRKLIKWIYSLSGNLYAARLALIQFIIISVRI